MGLYKLYQNFRARAESIDKRPLTKRKRKHVFFLFLFSSCIISTVIPNVVLKSSLFPLIRYHYRQYKDEFKTKIRTSFQKMKDKDT